MKADKLNIVIDADVKPAIKAIRKLERSMNKPNYRKILYIFYIPLLLVEWLIDLTSQLWAVFHKSIEILTLALEKYLNEPIKPPPGK